MWWDWQRTATAGEALGRVRPVYFEGIDSFIETRVLLREELEVEGLIVGPAVIHQLDSTVLLPPGFVAEPQARGSLVLLARDARDAEARRQRAALAAGRKA